MNGIKQLALLPAVIVIAYAASTLFREESPTESADTQANKEDHQVLPSTSVQKENPFDVSTDTNPQETPSQQNTDSTPPLMVEEKTKSAPFDDTVFKQSELMPEAAENYVPRAERRPGNIGGPPPFDFPKNFGMEEPGN